METKLVPLIGKDEIGVIVDICNRCYFPLRSEKQLFFNKVCKSVGVDKLEEISEDQFEKAYHVALALLHKVGEDVFKTKKNWNHYKTSDLIKFSRGA